MDLNALLAALNGLGSWGPIIGAVIVLVVNYVRSGKALPSAPTTPTTPATPAQPDAPLINVIPNRPLLNAGLQLLQLLAQRRVVQTQAPVTPFAAAVYDPHQALEDDVLKRVAAEIATQTK